MHVRKHSEGFKEKRKKKKNAHKTEKKENAKSPISKSTKTKFKETIKLQGYPVYVLFKVILFQVASKTLLRKFCSIYQLFYTWMKIQFI